MFARLDGDKDSCHFVLCFMFLVLCCC